jgi:predicted PurR-regulated permease PerM
LTNFGVSTTSVTQRLEAGAGEIASSLAGIAGMLASRTFAAVLGMFFAVLAMHLVLLHWTRMVSGVVVVAPLEPHYTRSLLAEFRRVGRTTVLGTVLTGVVQGVLAMIGFWLTGVPHPIFFGIATMLSSLVPAVGTLLIWIPAAIYLFATGHPAAAIIEFAWGALFVAAACDYVVRPRFAGGAAMPTLLTFIALFGGLAALGVPGLIVGPVIMSLAVAVLRFYSAEESRKRSAH